MVIDYMVRHVRGDYITRIHVLSIYEPASFVLSFLMDM
jgi:hypothetical protein